MTENNTSTTEQPSKHVLPEIAEVAIVISWVAFVVLWFLVLCCIAHREQQRILAMHQAASANAVPEQRQTKMERPIQRKLRVYEWKESNKTDISFGGEFSESAPRKQRDTKHNNKTFILDKLQQMSKLSGMGDKDVTLSSSDSQADGGNGDRDEECAICLLKFEKGDHVCESNNTACHHIFHEECMTHWLLNHELCPICRCTYLEESA
jgi:hypothetical protein